MRSLPVPRLYGGQNLPPPPNWDRIYVPKNLGAVIIIPIAPVVTSLLVITNVEYRISFLTVLL